VGSAHVKVSALCVGGVFDEWYEIEFKGKSAGSVNIKSEWHPNGQQLAPIPL